MTLAAPISSKERRQTFWRTLQTFSITRIVIAAVLLAYVGFNAVNDAGVAEILIDWKTCVTYVLLGCVFALLSFYLRRRFMLQLLVQIATDVIAISMLYVAAGGAKSGLAILYLFPLAGGAILAPMLLALFFVSVVTLILLAESSYQILDGVADASPTQAGLYGAAFFAAIYMINRLAAKLIKQEELAARRGRDLRLQEAVNRLVIADMEDGILVVDRNAKIITINPAARRMLGLPAGHAAAPGPLGDMPSLAPIADAFLSWQDGGGATSTYVMVKPVEGVVTIQGGKRELAIHLKLRFAKVGRSELADERAVIFLQDVSEIENQAQQLKLASMGRLTASIAHEVRNPLSAISHAASLLSEEVTEPTQLRLLKIVRDNTVRLNRMIEDILQLSRKAQAHDEPLALGPFLAEFLLEFAETHGLRPDMIKLHAMHQYQARFDPLHLREVLVNLLTNALRYASGGDGSIRIAPFTPVAGRLELHVQDDGPAITPEVRAHLFEPFYTTSSKGTGLGLYVARELCLNNGAMLDYEYRSDMLSDGEPSGRFVITFAAPGSDPLMKN